MKLEWKDALAAIEDTVQSLDGEGEKWCEVMWMFIDKHNQNTYNSFAEKLAVYAKLNGIVKLFSDFRNKSLNYDYYEDYLLNIDIQSEVAKLLHDDDGVDLCDELVRNIISSDCLSCISSVLSSELDTATLYSMLKYFLSGYEDNEDDEEDSVELCAAEEYKNWFFDCPRTRHIIDYYCCNQATWGDSELYQWIDNFLQR